MKTQTLLITVLTSCVFNGIREISATSQLSGCYKRFKDVVTIDGSLIVSQDYSRSMMACLTSCQRSVYVTMYNCTAVLYDTETRICRHTVATLNDLMYDDTKSDTVFLYPKPGCSLYSMPYIDNGGYEVMGGGDIATLTCHPGYTSSLDNEPEYLRCDINGAWTTTNISCIPDDEAKQWSGRSFVTAFMSNYVADPYPTSIRLLIVESGMKVSSTRYSTVTIESQFVGFYKTRTLNGSVEIELPIELVRNNETEMIGNIVKISSDKPVNVFALTSNRYSTGGTMIMPSQSWSNSYVVAATPYIDANSRIMIITGDDDAFVVLKYPDGQEFNVSIEAYNTYQITRPVLAGTLVSSDTVISVLAGEQCANLPNPGNYSCDNIVTQLPPTNALDSIHIAARLYPRETFAILIVADPTNTTINETYVTIYDGNGTAEDLTLSYGESIYRVYSTSPIIRVLSYNNVMVTQYGVSASIDNLATGDVSMFVVPGVNKFMNGYKFVAPSNYTSSLMMTFNLQDDPYALNGILLNGYNISVSILIVYEASYNHAVCYVDVNPGVHTLTHTNSSLEFGAVLYGRSWLNEYAWILGMKHH